MLWVVGYLGCLEDRRLYEPRWKDIELGIHGHGFYRHDR